MITVRERDAFVLHRATVLQSFTWIDGTSFDPSQVDLNWETDGASACFRVKRKFKKISDKSCRARLFSLCQFDCNAGTDTPWNVSHSWSHYTSGVDTA